MVHKIEISIQVIIHATEDILGLNEEDFTIEETEGHYENPIIMINANIVKKQAQNFMNKLIELLPGEQLKELVGEIEERTENSRFHLRLDKQELIKGNLIVIEKGTIKLKIHTPVYNKKDTVKTFSQIFQIVN